MNILARAGRTVGSRNQQTIHAMNEEMRERDAIDEFIDNYQLERLTGKDHETLRKGVEKSSTLLNLCHMLAGVIDWLLLDTEATIRSMGVPKDNTRAASYFKEMNKLVGAARKWAQRCIKDAEKHVNQEDYDDDIDWWYNMVRLIYDRTGTDQLKTKQVIQWLSTMPSEAHMFNIHTKDFIHEQREKETT